MEVHRKQLDCRKWRVLGAYSASVRRGFEVRIKQQLLGPWPDARRRRLRSCFVAVAAPECEAAESVRPSVLHLMLRRMAMPTLAQIGEPWHDTETLCAETEWHSSGTASASNPSHKLPSRRSIRTDPSARIATGSKSSEVQHSMAANDRVFP